MLPFNSIESMINQVLGHFWSGLIQHQSHLGLIASLGLDKLANTMETRIADEPQTIRGLLDRLLNLDGQPSFSVATPQLGATLEAVLAIDIATQRAGLALLNQCVVFAAKQADAATRLLFERIVEDEEEHLAWLANEQSLLARLGEPAYTALRA